MAAHITAASPEGPRYDPHLTDEQRRGIDNGIWTCQNCGKLVDNDHTRYTVEQLRRMKADAELEAQKRVGKTSVGDFDSPHPTLPEVLRAPRPEKSIELRALERVYRSARFYLRVVRLVQDVSEIPNHSITKIARPENYHQEKRAIYAKFNEEYRSFITDLEEAIDLFEALVAQGDDRDSQSYREFTRLTREVATTVAVLLDWVADSRNDPIDLAKLHPTSEMSNQARDASKALMSSAARRMVELEKTAG